MGVFTGCGIKADRVSYNRKHRTKNYAFALRAVCRFAALAFTVLVLFSLPTSARFGGAAANAPPPFRFEGCVTTERAGTWLVLLSADARVAAEAVLVALAGGPGFEEVVEPAAEPTDLSDPVAARVVRRGTDVWGVLFAGAAEET